ncbi:uncharacterized protein LOC143376153 [Andrena cerasifolii]|uniref:uncharacterized protein LOC143376153 n=1 Tax=Andrena cerasifolii TaxID=2819439 RepID=UPI0040380EDA
MRLLVWSILCWSLVMADEAVAADRAVRSLAFRKGSSFFSRVNFKITLLPYTTIFAQAAGFKVVWELPSGGSRAGRSIAELHEDAELLYESQGFDGRSCLLKNLCETMEYVGHRDGVIGKIFKVLAGSYANNGNSTVDASYCDIHVRNCPLQLVGIDTLID